MVLADLGSKITRALQTMASSSIIDDEVVNKLTSSIAMALLQADVDIRLVKQVQNNIKTACSMEDSSAGMNKRKMIQHVRTQTARNSERDLPGGRRASLAPLNGTHDYRKYASAPVAHTPRHSPRCILLSRPW